MLYHMMDVIKGTWWSEVRVGGKSQRKWGWQKQRWTLTTTQLRPHFLVSSFVWNQDVLCIDNLGKQKTMKGCKVHREEGNNMVIFNVMTKVLALLSAVDITYSEG